jgi:hypothetical protein
MFVLTLALQKTFELTANAQLWPRTFNSQIGGAPNQAYLIVSDLGDIGIPELEFINGFTFLYVITASPCHSLASETN